MMGKGRREYPIRINWMEPSNDEMDRENAEAEEKAKPTKENKEVEHKVMEVEVEKSKSDISVKIIDQLNKIYKNNRE